MFNSIFIKMKTRSFLPVALFATALGMSFTACSDDDNNAPETPAEAYVWGTDGSIKTCDHLLFDADGRENVSGTVIGNGDKEFIFKGKQTLKKGTYLLRGWVYVAAGSELTIEPGTIIKGEKESAASLIVEPGAKIYAQGTATQPIVFTSAQPKGSRRPGDWGGLIVCGNGLNNKGVLGQQIEGGPRTKHGGNDAADNSGVLSYVRVEFAGYPFQKDKEINGITFGSVGSGTTVDHLQVSYSNDDSFEWFGGSVNCKNLVAFNGWDDEFDTDNGFSGAVEYALSIRDPRIADTSQSNGFESDNNASGAETTPFTSATFKHVTFIGPRTARNSDFENSSSYITAGSLYPDNGSKLGRFQAAMHLRRSTQLNATGVLAVGYPVGLILDGEKGNTVQYASQGKLSLKNIIFAGMDVIGTDKNKEYNDYLFDYTTGTADETRPSFSHTFFLSEATNRIRTEAELALTDPAGTGQNYCPSTALSDGQGGYIGAFRDASDNWLEGWTNFDPRNTVY